MNQTMTANPAKSIATLTGHKDRVMALAFSPDRCLLASAGYDATVRIWEVGRRQARDPAVIQKHGDVFHSVAFSASSRYLAVGSGSLNGFVWMYDVAEKQPREAAVMRGARGAVDAVAFSQDGKFVAGAGEDRTLRVWEPVAGSTGAPRTQLMGHAEPVRLVAFAPDGIGIATAAGDSTVRIWALSRIRSTERACVREAGDVRALAYSADGKTLATAGQDRTIRLWEMGGITPRVRVVLLGHTGVVRAVVFTPDGKVLVSAGEDGRVVNWDPQTGKPVQEWQLPGAVPASYALTGDGRYLACGSTEGTIEIYRVAEKRQSSD